MNAIQTKNNASIGVTTKNASPKISKLLKELPKEQQTNVIIELANEPIFNFYPNLFNFIITQSNQESQRIIFDALNSKFLENKEYLMRLLEYTDKPEEQRKINRYVEIPEVFYNEKYYILMMQIKEPFVEEKMLEKFEKNEINNIQTYFYYLRKFEIINRMKKTLKLRKN